MRIALVYNQESKSVINLFGVPNREKLARRTLESLTRALKAGGHQVALMEGDKDLIEKLGHFMPRVVNGERPGLVFNVSYGIQGQARYTHVPSILEMVGIPYVASGPLAHSLALDKVVTKMILRQHGLSTPDFAVMDTPDSPLPDLEYPLIVKPKNEALSFGLKIVHNEKELREGCAVVYKEYEQPILVERFIEGREINVALVGNNPPEPLPPVELSFGDGPTIYTLEDKMHKSGREVKLICPAPISEKLKLEAQELAKGAFSALGCYDCIRADMRLDANGKLYILEVNSLPAMGENSSFATAARHAGMDYAALVNRLVEVASARYFGTPQPPSLEAKRSDPADLAVSFVTQRRDAMEKRLQKWSEISSRTGDVIGLQQATQRADSIFRDVGLKPNAEFTDAPEVFTWETTKGFEGGTLFVGHLDAPVEVEMAQQMFRRDPEWFYGEGIGTARAPLVMVEYALRALRSARKLSRTSVGVLLYCDEGNDAGRSAALIRQAAAKARQVFVLRPGTPEDGVITSRHGYRKYRLTIQGDQLRAGRNHGKRQSALLWGCSRLADLTALSSTKDRVAVSVLDLKSERHAMLLPHRVSATLLVSYPDQKLADSYETKLREKLGKTGPKWELDQVAERPPMKDRSINRRLYKALAQSAEEHSGVLKTEGSRWPSVAGLVPSRTACICGVGPITKDRGTPNEAVQRISIVQRTLLITDFLLRNA